MSNLISCDHCGRLFPPDGEYHTVFKESGAFSFARQWRKHYCDDCFNELDAWSTYEPKDEGTNDGE